MTSQSLPDQGALPSAGGTRRSPNNTRQTLYRQTLVCRVFVVGHSAKTLLSAQKTLGKLFFQKNKKRHADTTPAPPAPPPPSTPPPPRRGRREGPTTPHHHQQSRLLEPLATATSSSATIAGSYSATPLSCDAFAVATSARRHQQATVSSLHRRAIHLNEPRPSPS